MASKRKRKLERKASIAESRRMVARRDAFSETLWRFGPAFVVIVIILSVIFLTFFYEAGTPKPDSWKLEEAETGVIYSSDDYYSTGGLTLVEFFHSDCGHCQNQAPELKEIYGNYSDQIAMFSIGGYKLSEKDTKNDVSAFKFKYTAEWPHLFDPSGELMRDYCPDRLTDPCGFPSLYLIKDEEIVFYDSGFHTYDQLSAEIDKHL